MTWIDARGATLQKLIETNPIWVVDRMPSSEGTKFILWEADAEAQDNMDALMRKWLEGTGLQLPHLVVSRLPFFIEQVLNHNPDSVLVVSEAHLLKPVVLRNLRILGERASVPVILVGDVAKIRAATDDSPDFKQRVMYLVRVTELFE